MKQVLLISLLLLTTNSRAQLIEDFADGNFTSNPSWTGSNNGSDFTIADNMVRSNSGAANSSFYLSTDNQLAVNAQWEFWVNLQFSTSGSNYVDIYIISDKADLKASSINGYFIRIGNTDDEISLYRRSGTVGSSVKIIDGANGSVGASNNTVRIKLKRETNGLFTLDREIVTNNSSFVTEGSVLEASHLTSSHTGILVQQSTASFFNKHYFDNFKIAPIVVDNLPPSLSSIANIDSNTVEILFNEAMDSVSTKTSSYYFLNSVAGSVSKVITTNEPNRYILKFGNSFTSGTHTISVTNVTDRNGNVISQDNSGSFSYIKPYIVRFRDIVINEIYADPTPQIDLPSVEFAEIRNNSSQTLSLKNWKFSDSGSTAAFGEVKIEPGSFIIICAKADTAEYKSFGKVVGLSPWPSLNNSGELLKLISPDNRTIDSVKYSESWYRPASKKPGGWTLERRDPLSICEGIFNWFASVDSTGGTPGKENSNYVKGFDKIPLSLDSVKQVSDTTISIIFNKNIDEATMLPHNFILSPNTALVKNIAPDPERLVLLLTFDKKLLGGQEYYLEIQNVKDCSANLLSGPAGIVKFKTIKAAPLVETVDTGRVMISEIFADPSPEVQLPLSEFIEIYNPSNDTLDLDKWTLSDPTTSAIIRGKRILPGEYLILCPLSDTVHYKSYGKTIGLNPWPSLNNAADQLIIKSMKNRIVDSVAYSDSWYKNITKKAGGWSIEKTDLFSICENNLNWTASIDTAGGTPGRQNSVYTTGHDNIALKADSLRLLSDGSIKLYFNKHLKASTLLPGNFKLIPETVIESITPGIDYRNLTITFKKRVESGIEYQMGLSGIKDCTGNILSINEPLKFKTPSDPKPLPEPPDSTKIFITEIFADPSPEVQLPLVEFVEIYNPTNDTVNLDKWVLSDATTKGLIQGKKLLPYEYAILCPIADTAQFKSFGKVIGLNPWPSLNNNSDQVMLRSVKNRLVDSVSYTDNWYKNQSKKSGGWSLERIDIKSLCESIMNWAASIDTNGGTPARKNSVAISNYDSIILKADSIKLTSDTTLKVYFNKYLNSSALPIKNIKLIPASTSLKQISIGDDLKEATLNFAQKLNQGTSYELVISDLKSCSDSSSVTPQILNFRTDPTQIVPEVTDTAKILITEIFADPSPEVHLPLAEFIEIHNPSKNAVDLDKWSINDPVTKAIFPVQKILPGEYIILCPVTDTAHYNTFGKTIGLSPWPSLNNVSDQIILKSFKNRTSDSVAYSDTWYHSSIKKQGGWSLEKIDLKSACDNFFNWNASIDTSGGTPGRRNSNYIPNYGALPFTMDSLKLISDTSIKVYFNKNINSSTLISSNFNFSPSIQVKTITADSQFKEISITVINKFQTGTKYHLAVANLRDCTGKNINEGAPLSFIILPPPPPIPEKPDTGKIVITEIFADPSPEVGLPLAEFVEIFNPGENGIDLENWDLGDSGTKGVLKNVTIGAGEYLIICPAADTVQFKQFGKTKGITQWPILGNNADQITLKSGKKRLVDSVAYSDKWYKSKVKKNGGWTLEKIDILNTSCNGFYNWESSNDRIGGTPGRQNSAVRPLPKLKIDSLKSTSDSTVVLYLNSVPDTVHLSASKFWINNKIGRAKDLKVNDDYKTLQLKFATKFQEGINYVLTADSLLDCRGEKISPQNNNSNFSIPVIPEHEYSVVINEIMADPSPEVQLPEIEFVELFNTSEKTVNLKGMVYGDESRQYKFIDGEIQPRSFLILCPEKDTLSFQRFGKVLGLSEWPALGNEQDVIFLRNNKGREFHRVSYNSSWYKDPKKKTGGYSLELLNDRSACKDFQNWAGSNDPTGGTPGRQNSIFLNNTSEGLKLTDAILTDSVTLMLTFNKSLDSLLSSSPDNFQLNNGVGKPQSVLPLGPAFEQILLKFSSPLARGHVYKVNIINLRDCAGLPIMVNFDNKEFTITEKISKDDVLINEILFNPRPGGTDFVEIYNNSKNTLDLQELSIANISNDTIGTARRISNRQLLFDPGHYILLTADPENVKKEYTVANPQSILKIALPQFNDDKGTVVLTSGGLRIDQLDYNEKMHFQLLKNFDGVSLERSSAEMSTNTPGNFRSATAAAGFATPGYKNSQFIQVPRSNEEFAILTRTFSPDNDGFEDIMQVSYTMPAPGMVANIKIFNDKGVLIRQLLKNSTLNSTGFVIWDGMNESGSGAEMGIYYISAEIFDTNGTLRKFRRSFVLAKKL